MPSLLNSSSSRDECHLLIRMSYPSARPFVLLVEDSDDDAFFFQRALRKSEAQFDVVRVSNGADAIQFFETCFAASEGRPPRVPDYVFLDLKLPVLSGFEILECLSNRRVLEQLKIAILSGSESVADVRRSAELGVNDYLVKPVPVSTLRERLSDQADPESGVSAF